MSDLICTACVSTTINVDCPECYGLGVKTGAPFNLTDHPTKCTTCADNPNVGMPLGACPSCGGKKVDTNGNNCLTCSNNGANPTGNCYGCHGDQIASNRANVNPTVDELLQDARITRAQYSDNCSNTSGEQTNREQCQNPISKGDVVMTVKSRGPEREGYKGSTFCTSCLPGVLRTMTNHEEALGLDSPRWSWTKHKTDDELTQHLDKHTKSGIDSSGEDLQGQLQEVSEGVAVPDKSREASVKEAGSWKRIASLDEIIADNRVESIHQHIHATDNRKHREGQAWQASLDLETWLEITPRPSL